jgi:hypothetical protein
MKIVRWAAAAALTLISITGIGLAFGGAATAPTGAPTTPGSY